MNLPEDSQHTLIAELAYRMYEQDGKPDGKAEEHWARAERALGVDDTKDASQIPRAESTMDTV